MKKLISVILAAAMVLSLAACDTANNSKDSKHRDRNSKETLAYKPEFGDPEVTDVPTIESDETTEPTVTTETSETTTEATTEATTTTVAGFGRATDYVIDVRSDYKHLEIYSEYHVPKVLLNSSDVDDMQKEIEQCFEGYAADIAEYGNTHYYSTDYAAFLTQNGILTVVFVENGEWDDDIFHVWNFDVTTGKKVPNYKIASAAGISHIRQTAMDAAQAYLNNSGMFVVENYELVSPDDEFYAKAVEDTFSEERLNDDMMIGLMNDGSIFFVSGIASYAGGEWYYRMYDAQGKDLHNVAGWVR